MCTTPSRPLWLLPLWESGHGRAECLPLEADKPEFECRLCHFPAGEDAREFHRPPFPPPTPLALCLRWAWMLTPVGSRHRASGSAKGRHWQGIRGKEEWLAPYRLAPSLTEVSALVKGSSPHSFSIIILISHHFPPSG